MLLSLALIFIVGMTLGGILEKVKIPKLLGMIVTGIVLGPYTLDLINPSLLNISAELRKIALIIILIKAGLSLDLGDLKRVGRPAILMSFVPATCEIIGVIILAPLLFGISIVEAGIMGAVLAAVSPAVLVPRMASLMERGYGKENSVPQLLMAAASLDDIFVIVVFSSFLGLEQGGDLSVMSFAQIPISILLGVLVGVLAGIMLIVLFKAMHMRDSVKVILILSMSFLLVTLEDAVTHIVPLSGLVGVMVVAMSIKLKRDEVAVRLSSKFSKLWVCAEVVLFVLVGATVDLGYATSAGVSAIVLVAFALMFRMAGVFVCVLRTPFTLKERLFCMVSFTPKATVQAAIGGIALSLGLGCGDLVLTIAVLSILITAPLGAFLIDFSYNKLLKK